MNATRRSKDIGSGRGLPRPVPEPRLRKGVLSRVSQCHGEIMSGQLDGRLVLVVEDEPLVALHVQEFLKRAGARVLLAHALPTARVHARHPALSAAVLDHGLKKNDTSEIYTILKERRIPFVLYSGYSNIHGDCADGELVHKPAPPHVLVTTLAGMLGEERGPLN
jgi:CheY-like chemotaxis protein